MKWLWFLPYAAVGAAYIRAAWKKERKPQALLKPLLLPLLFLARMALAGWDVLLGCGLILGWFGDLFLMISGRKWFVWGLVSFLIGHVFYIFFAARALLPVLSPIALLWCAFWAFLAAGLYRTLFPHLDGMRTPVAVYCAALALLGSAGFVWYFSAFTGAAALFCLGGVWFVTSDYLLARGLFDRPAARQDFLVMSTYILAQLLICLSSVLSCVSK